jgi:hypothetical protein
MGSIPFAFSVHHFINSVGADAGFAAIIGLAVLALLFFAQARETATLRDEAQESAQRVQQLEARLAQLGRVQPTGPVDAPSSVGQPSGPAPGRPAPAPPGFPATAAGRAQGAEAHGTEARPAARPIPGATAAGASVAAAAADEAEAGGAAAATTAGEAEAGAAAATRAGEAEAGAAAGGASPPAQGGGESPAAGAGGESPSAPAGVGAPALTAATRLIPPSEQEASSEVADAPLGAPGADESEAGAHSVQQPVGAQSLEDTAFGAAPATAAGSAAAAEALREAANGAPPEPVAAPTGPSRTGQPPRGAVRTGVVDAARPRPSSLRSVPGDSRPPSRARRVLPVLIVLIAIAAIVIGLLAVTSGGTSSNRRAAGSNAASNAPSALRSAKRAGPKPSSVMIAVLNGTATSGLAHRVAVKLGSAGYKQGTVATATDQTRTATVVAYMPSHKRDALPVASTLKLGPASVQPVDANTQAVACPPPAACSVSVVVTVGSDLSRTQ